MKYQVQELSDVDLAFPARVEHLMPKYEDIPEEFKNWNNQSKFNKFFCDMFYRGVNVTKLTPKEGVDPKKAWRHLRAIAGSFEPKHEHKEAAFAYLMSEWFEDIEWEVIKK